MMGRYSLDHPGLILANAGDTLEQYVAKVGKSTDDLSFQPDRDGIIPVLDGEWFEDDIVARSREFLRVTFPASSLNTDLAFIETALGKDLRKYFCTDFYKDHLQTYKKRPIYWLVQSPKKGFSCLIYLHRYTKDTLNLVLNNYFRPYLQKLEARLAQLGLDQLNDALPSRDRTAARKEAEKITKVLKECQAWEQDSLLPLAQQRIELDLDDGVKVNYLKLQDVLAPIPGLAAKEE
jgi:type II restriction/modification system DNA methylase subunit YeeA